MEDVFIGHICVTQILWKKKKKGFTYLFIYLTHLLSTF